MAASAGPEDRRFAIAAPIPLNAFAVAASFFDFAAYDQ
jgi:hypothetical protein